MTENTFTLKEGEDFIPLIQLLKAAGIAQNGGEAQALVCDGRVTLNGAPEQRKRAKCRPGDRIAVAGYPTILIAPTE